MHLFFEQTGALTVDDHEDGNGIGANSLGQPTLASGGLVANEFAFRQGPGAFNGSFYGDSMGMVASPGGSARTFEQNLGAPRDLRGREIWIRVALACAMPPAPRAGSTPTTWAGFPARSPAGRRP